jgi:UDPglucose 6-dehydrogenase/UDP-N-acetyl-D-galactosamine dehydrogenase
MVSKVSKKRLQKTVCIVGPGYVGLPLAQVFSRHVRMIGYRCDRQKVDALDARLGDNIETTTDPAKIQKKPIL